MELSKEFAKIVGQRINVQTDVVSFYSTTMKRSMDHSTRHISGDCKTVRQIFDLAAKNKLYVRFWYEKDLGPKDSSDKRLNVVLGKDGSSSHYCVKQMVVG